MNMDDANSPVFSAVSTSAHHLYILLRCIGFAPKASVRIMPEGIRFSAEEGRVIQGLAFLQKALFSSYNFRLPSANRDSNSQSAEGDAEAGSDYDVSTYPSFMISLSALIETLQILGISDSVSQTPNPSNPSAYNAFASPALLLNRTCTISYFAQGYPLCITLNEAGITTTCELTTYELDDPSLDSSPIDFDIPLQRDALVFKTIMRSTWLHNAITELDSTAPTVLTLSASATKPPFFTLSGSGGPFSESTVEFSIDKEADNSYNPAYKNITDNQQSRQPKRGKLAPTVAETFLVHPPSDKARVKQSYRFSLVRKALRAMALSSKVSIRCDRQGVLSMQFMIELGEGISGDTSTAGVPQPVSKASIENVSFVDFRFVPLVDDDESEEGREGSEEL
ncbi:hypothetical protein VTO42DRAFT_5042 [Malbranchea cinnamomea]